MEEQSIFMQIGDAFVEAVIILYETSFVWLPLVLIGVAFILWIRYIRQKFIFNQEKVLLEIKIPQEIKKSPAAMEIFLSALYQKGGATYLDTYLGGKIPPWFSLELVSIGGDVHMYVWCWQKFQRMVETQLYAQYPNVEIYKVDDYTLRVPYDLQKYPMWAGYFKLANKDPFPIKTYIDYGLDKDPDDEVKIDPMTAVLEYLGSLQKGEQCWIQILVQANKSEWLKEGRTRKKPDWKKDVEAEIEKIQKISQGEEGKFGRFLTKGEQDTLLALERSLSKPAFDCGVRGIYVAEEDAFSGENIPGLIGSFRQYSSNTLNGFKLGFKTDVDYPWQDFRDKKVARWKKQMLEAYKMRSFHQEPHKHFKQKPIILTTEELATIFHPTSGIAVQTPTFQRIPSRKAEPPANLPT